MNNNKNTNIIKKLLPVWVTLATLSLTFLLLIGLYIILASIKGDERPMVAIADKFKPGQSWQLVSENIMGPRLLCVGDVECPSLSRNWKTGVITGDEFRALLAQTGWEYAFEGDCDELPRASGSLGTICMGKTVVDGFNIRVYMNGTLSDLGDRSVSISMDGV